VGEGDRLGGGAAEARRMIADAIARAQAKDRWKIIVAPAPTIEPFGWTQWESDDLSTAIIWSVA